MKQNASKISCRLTVCPLLLHQLTYVHNLHDLQIILDERAHISLMLLDDIRCIKVVQKRHVLVQDGLSGVHYSVVFLTRPVSKM